MKLPNSTDRGVEQRCSTPRGNTVQKSTVSTTSTYIIMSQEWRGQRKFEELTKIPCYGVTNTAAIIKFSRLILMHSFM